MIAADSSSWIAFLQGEPGADARLLDKALQDRRLTALAGCLDKLPGRDRALIARRYAAGASVQSVADEIRRPATSIYRSLERIRQILLSCIQREVISEEHC